MDEFSRATTNEEIINSFQKINNILEKNLLEFTDIDKSELLRIAKEKKLLENINWNLIKSKFGDLLKFVIYKKKEMIMWKKYNINKNKKGYLYDILLDNFVIKNNFTNSKFYVKKASVNTESIILLTDKNEVFVKGLNTFNKFGSESYKNLEMFTKLKNIPENCRDVVNGYSFAFYIFEKEILACGCGESGRTGTNNLKINNFDKVLIEEKVIQVCCSSVSSAFLTENGDIYSCGSCIYNGHNKEDNILIPKKIIFDSKFKFIKISSGEGGYHFGVLNENGDVYVWGHNRVGQLGINPKEIKEVKRKFKVLDDDKNDDHEIVLTVPYKLNLKRRVFDINFSWGHSCLIFSNNDISLFGRNCCNQLGLNKDHCIIDKKSHEYYYKQNILNTHMKIDQLVLKKYGTLMLSENIIYYFGALNDNSLKIFNYKNDFECKKLKEFTDYNEISIIDNRYVII